MKIIPIFLPYAGCKHRCVFCDQVGSTGEVKRPSPEEIDEKISQYLRTGKDYEIAFYGGTFTGLPRDIQRKYLAGVSKWIGNGVKWIRVSTRPDEIDEAEARTLLENGVRVVEIGAQSMFDDVLEASGRGHSSDDVVRTVKMLKRMGFIVGVHLMVGLPRSSHEKDLKSAKIVSSLGIDIARIHPTLVFKNTELFNMMKDGRYKPLSLEDALETTAEMVIIMESRYVKVIRLGLYVPVELRKNVVAGPYHPSFGDMVRSVVVRKIVERLKIKHIIVDHNHESWIYGYGNRRFFEKLGITITKGESLLFNGLEYHEALKRCLRG